MWFAVGQAERGPHYHGFPRPGQTHGGVVVVDGGDPPALRGHSLRIRPARTSRNPHHP